MLSKNSKTRRDIERGMKILKMVWEDGKQRPLTEARPEGRRTRGRPRKTYMDGIEDIIRRNCTGIAELRKTAGNRRDRRQMEAVPNLWFIKDCGKRRRRRRRKNKVVNENGMYKKIEVGYPRQGLNWIFLLGLTNELTINGSTKNKTCSKHEFHTTRCPELCILLERDN